LRRIFLCSIFLFLFVSHAFAVTPPFLDKQKVRLSVTPGQTVYGDLVMENPSAETRQMRVYLEDWSYLPEGNGSKKFFPAGSTSLSCSPWITFSPAEFTLPAYGKQRISFSVKMPKDARGTYYSVMFMESVFGSAIAQQQGISGGLSLAIRVGALFYIEAKGTIKRSAVINNLSVKKDTETKKTLVSIDLRNTGNTDITAGGSFHIMNNEGLILARSEFSDAYTFGGSSAQLTAFWKENIPAGKYSLVLTINIGKALEELGLGRGPIIIKEAEIEIGQDGSVLKVGELN